MKKILSDFNFIIIYGIIFALSYISDARGIQSQGDAFMYLSLVLIFFTAVGIATENLLFNNEKFVFEDSLTMFGIYWSIFIVSIFARKLLNVELGIAFQLIAFGMVLEAEGVKIYRRKNRNKNISKSLSE